jgi:basic membrane protein A
MRRILALASVLALVLALAPAATAGNASQAAYGLQAVGPRFGLVTDGSPVTDRGYSQYTWAGVQARAKALHGTAEVVVPAPNEASYAWAIERFAQRDFDVIVTVGFLMADVTRVKALAHPDVQFLGVDQVVPAAGAPPNYQRLVFDEAEAGYLAGIAAASMSKTGTIGAVGGMQAIPAVLSYINGYRNGARSVKPSITVLVTYTEDFSRPDLGYDQATDMIKNHHADVVFGVAGRTDVGVYAAACDAKTWAIGVDVDAYLAEPTLRSCILTSAEKRVARATSLAIQRFIDAGLQGGSYVNDASNGGIGVAPIRNAGALRGLPAALKVALAGLANGSINPCAPTACSTP